MIGLDIYYCNEFLKKKQDLWKTSLFSIVYIVDNIDKVCYNGSITINRKDEMNILNKLDDAKIELSRAISEYPIDKGYALGIINDVIDELKDVKKEMEKEGINPIYEIPGLGEYLPF